MMSSPVGPVHIPAALIVLGFGTATGVWKSLPDSPIAGGLMLLGAAAAIGWVVQRLNRAR